jgi:iron complex outermembrane receptor protein
MIKLTFTRLASAAVALHVPSVAAAKEADEPAKAEIVVTGLSEDKGLETEATNGALGNKTLLDTPFSVTVVDAEEIDRRDATTIAQIFANDPAVFSFAVPGTVNWWGTQIRGLGVRNYYIDDVPLVLYWGGDFALESIESVEALKGVTGFMYGFGAPGGAIAYRTKRPTAEPLLATEAGYRTSSEFYGHVDAGGPLTGDGRLGYRVNLAVDQGTAYNSAGIDRWLASLALEYKLTDDLDWYATATYDDTRVKHEPFHIYWGYIEGGQLPEVTYDYDKVNVDNSFYDAETLAVSTGFDWRFAPQWSARLTYGYTSKLHHSLKTFIEVFNQAGDYNGYVYNFAEMDRNHFAQAMVQGELATGPLRHEIVLGGSFMAYNSDFGLDAYYYDNEFNGNVFEDQTFLITRPADFSTSGSPYDERQYAAFASDTIHLGDHLQAIVGARYNRYVMVDVDGDPSVDNGYRTTALSPTFALIYKPAAWVSLYGSYVEALEAGGRVGPEYANVGEVLPATISRQYEIGAKYERDALSFTAAAFRIERANTIDRILDGERFLTQDGRTLYEGAEASLSYRLNRDLRIGLGAIYLDPRITEVSPENVDLEGNVPLEAYQWQLLANAEYHLAAVPGLSFHGNVRYFGKAPVDDANTLFVPAHTSASLGFQYETDIGGRRVAFTGNVNNLLGEKYWGLENFGEARNGSLGVKVYW